MLNQFRSHYPQGSVCSDLLTVKQGKYIVKVEVIVEGVTLATGLAGAETIEQAEDRARIRALELLNLNGTVTNSQVKPILPQREVEAIPMSVTPPISKENSKIELSGKNVMASTGRQSDLLDNHSSIPSSPSSLLEETPKKTHPVREEFPLSGKSASFSLESEKPSQSPTDSEKQAKLPREIDFPPEIPHDIEWESAPTSEPLAELPLAQEETPAPETEVSCGKTEPESIDFAEILARSNAELERLGWTSEQGRDFLLQRYGKRSRQLLSDEELLEFLEYLESLPSN